MPVQAQDKLPAGVAVTIPIAASNIQDGDIVVSTPEGYMLATTPYASTLYGVVVSKPTLSFQVESSSSAQLYPVTTSGEVYVRVSTINGPINAGDFVTSSNKPGIGALAETSGYILGTARESFTSSNPDEVGSILVYLNPNFNPYVPIDKRGLSVLSTLKNAAASPFLSPLTSLRYLGAVLVAAIAFAVGFWSFGRFGKTGIEALSRNPLAATKISMGIVVHVCLTILIMIVGIFLSYLILVL